MIDPKFLRGQIVADVLTAEARVNQKRGHLGMSHLSRCPRWQYWEFFQPKVHPTSARLLFLMGYVAEDMIRASLLRTGLYVVGSDQFEIVAPFDARCRGHIDGLLLYRGEYALLEIKKTVSVELSKILLSGVGYAHYQQVQAYMHWLIEPEVRQALLVYLATDNGRIEAVSVTRDDMVGAELESRVKSILAAIDAQEPPECTCGNCPQTPRRKA